jgi:hypothetical protein
METATTPQESEGWRERLEADRQGGALRELRDYLAGKQAELRRLLDVGSSPEDYGLHQKFLAAMEAADSAAVAFWEQYNKS